MSVSIRSQHQQNIRTAKLLMQQQRNRSTQTQMVWNMHKIKNLKSRHISHTNKAAPNTYAEFTGETVYAVQSKSHKHVNGRENKR